MLPVPMFDLEELIPTARRGDKQAFGRLVRANYNRVYRVVRGHLNSEEAARDITQQAWVKAWQHLDSFRGDASFSTWILRIATRLVWDHLRKRQKERLSALQEGEEGIEVAVTPEADPGFNPRAAVDQKEFHARFQEALERLSPKHRSVLILREVEEMSYDRIAEVLEISPGTVMSRIYNARKLIQPYLKDFL